MPSDAPLVEKYVAAFEAVGGEGADSMSLDAFAAILGKIGIGAGDVPIVLREVGSKSGAVSWRRFVEWCLEGDGVAAQVPPALQLIASRHSTHSFDTSRPVPHGVVRDILEVVRSLPSSANTQPWTVIVTQGIIRDQMSERMLQKFDAGDDGEAQYEHLPKNMTPRMARAISDYGRQFYEEHLGVARGDEAGRRAKLRPSYEFWGAPVHLVLCCPKEQAVDEGVDGIFLDMGTLLTAILLAAHGQGLGGTPHFSVAEYHDTCRAILGQELLPDDLLVVCGLSIGWPAGGRDPRTQPGFLPTRLGVDETTRWVPCDRAWLSADEGAAWSGGEHGLLELIKSRHCSHSLDAARPVPRDLVAAILEAARSAPSAESSQPWRVTVVQGEARDRLSRRMLEAFDRGQDGSQTYKKYSAKNTSRMQKGKDTYGFELYEQMHGLARDDKDGRRQKYRRNYEFWGAPVLLLLNLPASAVAGTFIDIGSFMYAILLSMHACGLGGKPLGSVAKFTDICREVLGPDGMPEDEHLICGIAMGWPMLGRDPRTTPDFFPSRLGMEEITRWAVDAAWSAE